ncbi:hypothetical protein N9D31_00070 [Oligoflexaceae bacterium]|nr:hypothetical protein [Oligoflexaceae bacterium]
MSGKPRKRIYLINRDFQLRYSFAASVVGLLTTLMTSAVIIVPLFTFEILKTTRFLPTPILVGMIVACLVNISIILAMGIFVTHRIAGPMYSLVRSFRSITEGNYRSSVRVRDDDDLKYVVRNFNEMVETLESNTKADIARLQELLDSEESPERKQLVANLLKSLEERIPERSN